MKCSCGDEAEVFVHDDELDLDHISILHAAKPPKEPGCYGPMVLKSVISHD